jgi:hypothetical protein
VRGPRAERRAPLTVGVSIITAAHQHRVGGENSWPPSWLRPRPHTALSLSLGTIGEWNFLAGGRMHLIILMIVFVALAAIIVWLADWTSGPRPS